VKEFFENSDMFQ
jgi:rRNA small subunit pseudouridine methyltransferase Nep1